jgi:hypothetical protein
MALLEDKPGIVEFAIKNGIDWKTFLPAMMLDRLYEDDPSRVFIILLSISLCFLILMHTVRPCIFPV